MLFRSGDSFSEDGSSFVPAAVAKEAKQIRSAMKKGAAFAEDSPEQILLRVDELITEEKAVKKALKSAQSALEDQTRQTIEQLSDDQVQKLLEAKWISPLMQNLYSLPDAILAALTDKVKALSTKYDVTLAGLEAEIKQTEASLTAMLDQLTGNPYDTAGLQEIGRAHV